MNLTEQLKARKEAGYHHVSEGKRSIMSNSTNKLIEDRLSSKALKVGDRMIDFTLPDTFGKMISLSDKLEDGNVVISFYRGGWCPYCNLELRAFQEILPEIERAGASFIAISPETPDNSLNTSEKNNLKFSVLSDIDNVVAKEIGLLFQMPEDLRTLYYDTFKIDLPKHNGNSDYELPMAATYVINQEGIITYAFVSEDYTERAEPLEILKVI